MPFLPTESRLIIQRQDNKTDLIEVDVSENEDYRFRGEVSRYPIEDGSNISDNISILPIGIELDLRFSDTPVSKFNPLKSLESAEGRGRKTALKLIGWFQTKETLIITSGFASISNMAIESITVPRSSDDGKSVLCRTVFAELPIIVKSGSGIEGATTVVITEIEHTAFGLIRLGDLS